MLSRTLFATPRRADRADRAGRDGRPVARTPPVMPLPILDGCAPVALVFEPGDLGVELAYERFPEPDGPLVRPTTRDTALYWIPSLAPVFAVSDGVIAYARAHADGHTIVVDHRDGWASVYHRLQHVLVAPTERALRHPIEISGGGVLGYVGASREAPLAPLRFELWKRDGDDFDPVDPLRFLRKWQHVRWDPPTVEQPHHDRRATRSR